MELYHVLNRGVDKRAVVMDNADRARFLHDLFVFNDQRPVQHSKLPNRRDERARRELLVHIHAFCLMGNHYHLLLNERVAGGISLFMRKLNMGYAKYFNEKHERSGILWQGTFKKIPIKRDAHFLYIPFYIHLNPLDFEFPEWREGAVKNPGVALAYLANYRWSSHLDYCGVPNFPSLSHREVIAPLFGRTREYEKQIVEIITNPALASASSMLE